jgi:hypothetical protein
MMTTQKKRRKSPVLTLKQEEKVATFLGMKVNKPSKALAAALNALSIDFGKLNTNVKKVFEIARKEGYPDIEIGGMIREKMKEHYSASTIQRVLESYPDAKYQDYDHSKDRDYKKDAFKMNASEHKDSNENSETMQEVTKVETTDKYKPFQDTIDTKSKLIKQLHEEIAGVRKENTEFRKQNEVLKKRNVELTARVTELEKQVKELKK